MPLHRVIISGGGTGGHIFPALAIANALKKINPQVDILFVGALGKMEMEKIPAAGYKIKGLPISGMPRKLSIEWFKFIYRVLTSLMAAKKIIKSFKPDVVVGVGGYASGPTLKAAHSLKIPTVIQEQNSYPGKTNKMLAAKTKKICVAYDGMEKWFPKEKIVLTGNPVRDEVIKLDGKKDRATEYFQVDKNLPTLLVIGGSLGAKTINEAIALNIEKLNNINVIWQTGKTYFEHAKNLALHKYHHIKVFDFINKMDYAYALADVVISRAGAIAISELCLVKKPSILVPSPNVAEDHQTKNAMALVNHSAAIMVKDNEASNKLVDEAINLIYNDDLKHKLQINIASIGFHNSADAIASIINEVSQ
jgi:UDP-N-acetylglucosamine--N-acetylmuramyl-(pentapeptide) pyrophosphoryl-undecaprenol N-acetylglucosamine transferase